MKSVRGLARQSNGSQPACPRHGAATEKCWLLKLCIRRIYIDSRYRDYPEQDSQTNCEYRLKRSVSCPDGAQLYVGYVQISNTVKTIQASVNDKLFWASRTAGGGPPTFNYQVLPEGDYDGVSLAAAVHTQMGTACTISYDENMLALKISSSTLEFKFVLPSEDTGYPTLKEQSCHAVIGHTASMVYAQTWASDRIPQMHRLNPVFVHSDIGEAQSMSPHGAQDVLRKITMTFPFGGVETDMHVSAWDRVDIGAVSCCKCASRSEMEEARCLIPEGCRHSLLWLFMSQIFKP